MPPPIVVSQAIRHRLPCRLRHDAAPACPTKAFASRLATQTIEHESQTWLGRCPLYPRKQTWLGVTGMSALCRFCCRSPLQAFLVGDSVAVMRFATGAGDDGAAESLPGAVFLFISSR